MKRYKLVKDLPTFSAGDEFYLDRNGNLVHEEGLPENVKCLPHRIAAYSKSTLEKFPNILKDWFEELPERPNSVWDLEEDDIFWMVDTNYDEVYQSNWLDNYDPERTNGDVYLTKEEAEKELSWRKARQILKHDTKGFKPDWTKSHEDRYNVTLILCAGDRDEGNLGHLEVVNCIYCIDREFYFATQADAEESMRKHSREWKIYLGVEEEE